MSLEVSRKKIEEILALLKSGHWQVPEFQRDYVWTQDQVKKLVASVLNSYPIGLITTWDQPQDNPHTPGRPLELKGPVLYKEFEKSPSVMKLVLDGKQRLTTLAMVFGGFKSKDGRFTNSGEWFLDLSAYLKKQALGVVVYKRPNEVAQQELNITVTCVRKRVIPFKHFGQLAGYIAKVNDPATYPNNQLPASDEREQVVEALTELQKSYDSFLVPYAEIPNKISLGDVCEIFDVLNTTGTRVSTFDLLHNILFKESNGTFHLRDTFGKSGELESLGLLCDEGRQEFFCQVVTGSYCAVQGTGRNGSPVSSIKGPDLINTPLHFYQKFSESLEDFDGFAANFSNDVLGAEVPLSEIPYPASIVIYFALRWSMHSGMAPYSETELNRAFKAFYWRNVLTNRYDQGFLTQFSVDLKKLNAMLLSAHSKWNKAEWQESINHALNDLFGDEYAARPVTEINKLLLDDETRGALRQLFLIKLKSNTRDDIVDATTLDWGAQVKADKVQLHHIFPRDWCKNNEATHPSISEYGVNCVANLTPLKAKTNNKWKANSPATAIKNLKLSFSTRSAQFDGAFIDSTTFDYLAQDNVGEFWKRRADKLANALYSQQFLS